MIEWKLRCELAAMYKIFHLLGWDDTIFAHITARIPNTDYILINPYGMIYDEITASSLIKINIYDSSDRKVYGEMIENKVGYNIHAAIHRSRPDAGFVIHTHSTPIVAVSSLESGLVNCSQYTIHISNSLSYHSYNGIFFEKDEAERLVSSMNKSNFCLLRSHGSIVIGETAEKAFFNQYLLQKACEVQVQVMSTSQPYHKINDISISKSIEHSKDNQDVKASNLLWKAMKRKIGTSHEC